MIQIKTFKVTEDKEASLFLKDNFRLLVKDGVKLHEGTVVVFYNSNIAGSVEDQREGYTVDLDNAEQELLRYQQQLKEQVSIRDLRSKEIDKAHDEVIAKNPNKAKYDAGKHDERKKQAMAPDEEAITASQGMIKFQMSKIATIKELIDALPKSK